MSRAPHKAMRALWVLALAVAVPQSGRSDEPEPDQAATSARLAPDHAAPDRAAQIEYDRLHVGFSKVVDADSSVSRWNTPYQGTPEHRLELEAFYQAVGHPEHARYYRERTRKKLTIVLPSVFALLAGAALTVAGGVLGVTNPFCRAQDHYATCIDADTRPNAPLLGVGLTLFVGGVAGVSVGGTIRRFPTNPDENFALAREHNRRLRQRLALPPSDDTSVPRENEPPPTIAPKRDIPTDPRPARLGPQNL